LLSQLAPVRASAEPNFWAVFRNALLRLRVHQTALKIIGGREMAVSGRGGKPALN